jgi:type I restriction enzyme S subunit
VNDVLTERLPSGWTRPPVYARYSVQLGKMLDEKRIVGANLAPYLRNVDVQWEGINTIDLPRMDFSEEDRERYALQEGDLLVCEGGEVGRTAIWKGELDECFFQKAVHRLRPTSEQDEPRFFRYFMRMAVDAGLFTLRTASTIPHLTAEQLRVVRFPAPPRPQQRAIANYLDRETARIDALIAAKERVLGLLAEKRRALVTRAVTRGLDPHSPLRDSGIPWLGEIPAHWMQCHLKRVLASVDYGISETIGPTGAVAVLRMGDIQDGEIDFSNIGFVDDVDEALLLRPGDLLFNRTNSLDQIGKVALFRGGSEHPVSFASYLVRFRCGETVLPEYLNWLLNSTFPLAWGRAQALPAIGQANLNPNRYGYLPISLPPIPEQEGIVAFIGKSTARINAVRRATEATIRLLKERRASFIVAAVTGQIDVEAAA